MEVIRFESKGWVPLVLSTALACLSCTNTVNTVEPVGFGATRQPVPDRRIISDPDVNDIVHVVSVNESLASNEFRKVQVDLYNTRSGPRTFNYKFEWYDATGMLIPSPISGFATARIQGREVLSISSVAPNPMASDFRLKLLGDSRE